jgi:hypothetical protein
VVPAWALVAAQTAKTAAVLVMMEVKVLPFMMVVVFGLLVC